MVINPFPHLKKIFFCIQEINEIGSLSDSYADGKMPLEIRGMFTL